MFFLQRQSKTIDNRAENLKQLCNTIKSFSFVSKLKEYIVDGSANVGSKVEEFSVNSMQSCLQEISLSGVLRIKQLEEL